MRKPAVAGMFYPKDKDELKRSIHGLLDQGKEVKFKGELKALIVPHAGYAYSGIVAGAGFKLLAGQQASRHYSKVILLGPSHQAYFSGAAIAAEDFETPLGTVKIGNISSWLKEELIVEMPEAHRKEHCLEVELPFLQETFSKFELYALVLGEVDEEKLAETIKRFIDNNTLIVVSSDLSHYLPYETAVKKDKETINKILHFDFSHFEACGERPIKVLMYLAKSLNWKPFLIDYKNSGDTAGDKSRVVGYTAIGYCK